MAFGPVVDARWLLAHLGEAGLRVVDCRWRLGQPGAGATLYAAGHIPGAAFLDVDRDMSAPPGAGRHPLPDPAAFQSAARRAGIDADSRVVAYDEAGEGGAARLWWLLRHFGHREAAVLDGGLRAWRAAGGRLAEGSEMPAPGRFESRPRDDDTVQAAEILDRLGDPALALIDARAPERYRGEYEPIDPVAGHVPGAVNLPQAALAPEGRYLPPEQLRSRLESAGASAGRELVAYCGSGIAACTVLLAAAAAGVEGGRLYPGSWSEWSSADRPVARG